MSHATIPKALREQLRTMADPACQDCSGEGYQTFTARSSLGYVEVRCPCVNRDGNEPNGEPEGSLWDS